MRKNPADAYKMDRKPKKKKGSRRAGPGPIRKTKPESQETYGPGKRPLPLKRPKTSNKRPRATPLRKR